MDDQRRMEELTGAVLTAVFDGKGPQTSNELARSINANPSDVDICLKNLTEVGIVCQVKDGWIDAERVSTAGEGGGPRAGDQNFSASQARLQQSPSLTQTPTNPQSTGCQSDRLPSAERSSPTCVQDDSFKSYPKITPSLPTAMGQQLTVPVRASVFPGARKPAEHSCSFNTSTSSSGAVANVATGTSVLYEREPVEHSLLSVSTSQPASAVVLRANSAVSTVSQSTVACSTPLVNQERDKIVKILDVLGKESSPISAKDVAQRSGLGSSRSYVNRYLYHLRTKKVVEQDGKCWRLAAEPPTEDDLTGLAMDLANVPPSKKNKEPSNSTADCDCKKRGATCHHYHKTEVHNHHYNTMVVGDHNVVVQGQEKQPTANQQPKLQ